MASEAQLNTLQQLYIAYFGRPAEPAGVTYWEGRIDAGMTLDEVANSFTSADEFVAKYGDDTAALVRAAYQNALGREVESEAALTFWVEQLESGDVTPADLMNSFFGTSDATDLAVLNNRTEVAKAYTAAAGENYDAAASAALLASVDDTQASVDAALEQVPGVPSEAFTLTEALAIQAEGGELPEGYTLSDTALVLEAGTIAAIGEQIAAAQAVVDGAANAEELEFAPEFAIEDSAENVLAAAAEENPLVADISLITLTDEPITAAQRDALVELGFDAEALPELAPLTLTAGLEDLATANAAKTAFLEGLELDTNLDGTVDVKAGNATEANVATLLSSASIALSSDGFTTLSQTNYEDATKTALQDADIATAVTDATKAVTTATEAAPEGATALLEAVSTQVEALEAQLKAEQKAIAAYAEEVLAFNAINSEVVGTVPGNLDFVDGEFGVSDGSGALSAVYATQTNGVWKLTTAGETAALARTADLFAKYDATVAANDTTTAATTALENAVEDVLLSEFDGHSVKNFGGVISGVVPSANPTVTVNLDAGSAVVYDTAADAAAGDGTQEEFTATFAAVADAETVTFDGVTYTAASGNGDSATKAATAFASAYNTDGSGSWDAVDNGNGTVTFTAKAVGNVTNVTTANFTGTTGKVTDVAINVEGVAAGSTTQITSTTTKVKDLKDALDDLTALNEAVADFEAARELSTELATLNEAITDATSAITDSVEDGGLGINLLPSTATTFTSKDDVFLFTEGANKSLASFGVSGEDKIFFGEGYSLVAIADDKAITNNVGDAAALEILWVQQGNNLVLYVEEETFAGNSSAGAAADITTVTLTGVNAADVSFEGGFLTIA